MGDIDAARKSNKEILIAEFVPAPTAPTLSGASELLIIGSDGENGSPCGNWRPRGFNGVLHNGMELCIRCDCIRALYRREWLRPEADWNALSHLMARMRSPPLSIDSETHLTDAAWAKALERVKSYGDSQVTVTRERL